MNFMRWREGVLNSLVACGLAAFIFFLARYIILPGEESWENIPWDYRFYAFLAATGFVVTAMAPLGLVLAVGAWVRSRRLVHPPSAKRAGWSILAFAVGVLMVWPVWYGLPNEADKNEQRPCPHAELGIAGPSEAAPESLCGK